MRSVILLSICFLVTGIAALVGSDYLIFGIPLLLAAPIAAVVTDNAFYHLVSGLPAAVVVLEQNPVPGLIPLLLLITLTLAGFGLMVSRVSAFGFILFSLVTAVFVYLISLSSGLTVPLFALALTGGAVLLYLAYVRTCFDLDAKGASS